MAHFQGLDVVHVCEEVASYLKVFFYSSLPNFLLRETKSIHILITFFFFFWKTSREEAHFLYVYLENNTFIQAIVVLRSIFASVWGAF